MYSMRIYLYVHKTVYKLRCCKKKDEVVRLLVVVVDNTTISHMKSVVLYSMCTYTVLYITLPSHCCTWVMIAEIALNLHKGQNCLCNIKYRNFFYKDRGDSILNILEEL
jgi:hypothetical protein